MFVNHWIPDNSRAGFADECFSQSQVVAASDALDAELDVFADAALSDLDDDTCE